MRFTANDGRRALWRALASLAALALAAGTASAQMIFDGNIVFNNNGTGTLAGQFTGAPTAAAGCPVGYTAGTLGSVTYTNNQYADPLLPNAVYQTNVVPSFQPGAGSPAFSGALTVPADGFFQQTCFAGAIGPNPGDDWTQGWTMYDTTGATRQDLHLPGMPDPRPIAIYANISLYSDQFWAPDSNYEVRGQLRVKDQTTLHIPAGVVVFEDRTTLGTIIIERGGKIDAIGTSARPIIITSNETPGLMTRGSCGGIVINGRARTSTVNSCLGDSAASEGGAIGFYGGNDDGDGSGRLRFVRVEFAGKEITPNNELNSFLFNAVGSSTEINYLQAFMGADDCFEWFGGTARSTHLIGIDGTDDGFDTGGGFRGKCQFLIIRSSPRFAPGGGQNGDKGMECDNNEAPNAFDQMQCAGRANPQVANATLVGDKRSGVNFPGPAAGINWRRATAGLFLNGIITQYKTGAVKIDDDVTWSAHCAPIPVGPPVFCPGITGVPLATGNVFLVRSAPNPFRNQLAFDFTLPQAGRAAVHLYSADGRQVATIADGEMSAGPHHVEWKVDRSIPSGMYFYRVTALGASSTGKVTLVE